MLLAAITGRAKDEIDSEDICQQRRFKLTAASPRQAAIANPCRTDWRQLRSRQWKRTTAWIGQSHWGRVARTAEAESALRKLQDRISEVATK